MKTIEVNKNLKEFNDINNLCNSINRSYQIKIDNISIIDGGFLHKKYLITSKSVKYVVKVLNNIKFQDVSIDFPINAIKYQNYLQKNRVLVPGVIPNIQGELYSINQKGEYYFLQECIDGNILESNQLTLNQIKLVGENIAQIHLISSEFTKMNNNKKYKKIKNYKILQEEAQKREVEINDSSTEKIKMVVEKQNEIIEDIKKLGLIEELDYSYIHNDLTVDNIIIEGDSLKSIVDFEMSRVNSPLQDVGRFLLTISFDGKNFNNEKIKAFIKGYNKFYNIGLEDIVKALQIVWINESGIWLTDKLYHIYNPPKVQKFMSELEWITDNWFVLKEKLESDINEKK